MSSSFTYNYQIAICSKKNPSTVRLIKGLQKQEKQPNRLATEIFMTGLFEVLPNAFSKIPSVYFSLVFILQVLNSQENHFTSS